MEDSLEGQKVKTEKVQENLVLTSYVKSNSKIKFTEAKLPFAELQSNTDLNLPPTNWLRDEKRTYDIGIHNGIMPLRNETSEFASFLMAQSYSDCIGEVDLVAAAESIKKLLKMPYSKAQVSMMVHKVGNTLLIDEFDISKYLLSSSTTEWQWFKKFYFDTVRNDKSGAFPRKGTTRSHLQNKNMFSKFLHRSIQCGEDQLPNMIENQNLASERFKKVIEEEVLAGDYEASTDQNAFCCVSPRSSRLFEPNQSQACADEDTDPEGHIFKRNILWTFEDIQMLIGSDMPIFGCGIHPCVSLRLRDMKNPINVLTGLDYWLDNLMCNVPEVLMCYHLDGIVQKYEIIKTEDMPYLDGSKFSPVMIKDIAQNILSFLKNNATKEGHTYWLFKGHHDDVVKLYDLSTLCGLINDDVDKSFSSNNPFTFPVAMLLYRVALNLLQKADKKRLTRIKEFQTVHKLLTNCLALLNHKQYPQIAASAYQMLSDLHMPAEFVESNLEVGDSPVKNDSVKQSVSTSEPTIRFESPVKKGTNEPASVNIESLCVADKRSFNKWPVADNNDDASHLDRHTSVYRKCMDTLELIAKGLKCLDELTVEEEEKIAKSFEQNIRKEKEKMDCDENVFNRLAKPFQPIPLHYSSLKAAMSEDGCGLKKSIWHKSLTSDGSTEKDIRSQNWKWEHKIGLLHKSIVAIGFLANDLFHQNHLQLATKYIKLGLLAYSCVEKIMCTRLIDEEITSITNRFHLSNSLAKIAMLAGDVHYMTLQKSSTDLEQDQEPSAYDYIMSSIQLILQDEFEHDWLITVPAGSKKVLEHCIRCYNLAELENKEDGQLKLELCKRLGNVQNDLGVFYMNYAYSLFNDDIVNSEDMENHWKLSQTTLELCLECFTSISDAPNMALVNSNLGKLMRLKAYCSAPTLSNSKSRDQFDSHRKGELTNAERTLYVKAVKCYERALICLSTRELYPTLWDYIQWDLSTTQYNFALLYQDYPPLSSKSQEEVVSTISSMLLKTLNSCDLTSTSSKQLLYQFRAAHVYHRLASLYHNAYRNQMGKEVEWKQNRIKAEGFYDKAADLYLIIDNINKYLTVNLEKIGLLEHQVTASEGSKHCKGLVESIIRCIVNCSKIIFSKNVTLKCNGDEDDSLEEYRDRLRLLSLLQERLLSNVLILVKCIARSKRGRELEDKYKSIYRLLLETNVADKSIAIEQKFNEMCNVASQFL